MTFNYNNYNYCMGSPSESNKRIEIVLSKGLYCILVFTFLDVAMARILIIRKGVMYH